MSSLLLGQVGRAPPSSFPQSAQHKREGKEMFTDDDRRLPVFSQRAPGLCKGQGVLPNLVARPPSPAPFSTHCTAFPRSRSRKHVLPVPSSAARGWRRRGTPPMSAGRKRTGSASWHMQAGGARPAGSGPDVTRPCFKGREPNSPRRESRGNKGTACLGGTFRQTKPASPVGFALSLSPPSPRYVHLQIVLESSRRKADAS